MTAARDHYDTLLGEVYSWSVAAPGDPFARAERWLKRHALDRASCYLDLGAGFGAHTVPLARAGKKVTAVDSSAMLVAELKATLRGQLDQVEIYEGNLLHFLENAHPRRWEVILCLGDTLAHLPRMSDVPHFLSQARSRLVPWGRLAITYRDSTTFAAQGTSRFFPVAKDEHRTMHCLLEPIDDEHLRVTDIVTEVHPEGPRTRLGDYVKLRIAPASVTEWAQGAGFVVEEEAQEEEMTYQLLRRPAQA
jgi:SAM-dependent methyltransferase